MLADLTFCFSQSISFSAFLLKHNCELYEIPCLRRLLNLFTSPFKSQENDEEEEKDGQQKVFLNLYPDIKFWMMMMMVLIYTKGNFFICLFRCIQCFCCLRLRVFVVVGTFLVSQISHAA